MMNAIDNKETIPSPPAQQHHHKISCIDVCQPLYCEAAWPVSTRTPTVKSMSSPVWL